jgi:hypothetical protein
VVEVREVRVGAAETLSGRVQNLVRRFPVGYTFVELGISGPDVNANRPWDEEAMSRLCDETGRSPEVFVNDEAAATSEADAIVQVRFETTDPEAVTYFLKQLPGPVSGEYLPTPSGDQIERVV